MAEIRIEKRRTPVWIWILVVIVVALLAWAAYELFLRPGGPAVPAGDTFGSLTLHLAAEVGR